MNIGLWLVAVGLASEPGHFETGASRPMALDESGDLWVVNSPDGRLERIDPDAPERGVLDSVFVGLAPVAVAVRDHQAWVVNQISDSVTVIDLDSPARVIAAIPLPDEPGDIVFAGGLMWVSGARRGQAVPDDVQPAVEGLERATLWGIDPSTHAVVHRIPLFADPIRALASDGETVYAATFLSGSQTAVVPEHIVCDGGAAASPCVVDGWSLPGGVPGPNIDSAGVVGPETSLIVRWDGTTWVDELGRDWGEGIRFDLPDYDVFAVSASADQPIVTHRWSAVGTVLYGLTLAPDGALLVAGTQAQNHQRFSGLGDFGGTTVRGDLHRATLTRIDGETVEVLDLNPHLGDRSVADIQPPTTVAQPVALTTTPDGAVWVTSFGGRALAKTSVDALQQGAAPSPERLTSLTGLGPSGVLYDAARDLLYVTTRFDNGLAVIDPNTATELWHLPLHTAENATVVAGRAAFFDATVSETGEASCGVCHVFGHTDALAWDLGNPDGVVRANPNPLIEEGPPGSWIEFHPLKGPMTTQTLRGISDGGPLHWRGDRNGGLTPDSGSADPYLSFLDFDETFVDLLGAPTAGDPQMLEHMASWALSMRVHPNPYRPLDDVLTASQQAAWDVFSSGDCIECHRFDPDQGHWGTAGEFATTDGSSQGMKVPGLRQSFDKVGLFWSGSEPRNPGPADVLGPQTRAFGFFHDGSVGTLPDVVLDAVLAFPSDVAPMVGHRLHAPSEDPTVADELLAQADLGRCDLVAHGPGVSMLYRNGTWVTDPHPTTVEPDAPEMTWTCVLPGDGDRLALDRDLDGHTNASDNCPAWPNPDQLDADGDGTGDVCEVPSWPGDTGQPVPQDESPQATVEDSTRIVSRCGCALNGHSPRTLWPILLMTGLVWRRRMAGVLADS